MTNCPPAFKRTVTAGTLHAQNPSEYPLPIGASADLTPTQNRDLHDMAAISRVQHRVADMMIRGIDTVEENNTVQGMLDDAQTVIDPLKRAKLKLWIVKSFFPYLHPPKGEAQGGGAGNQVVINMVAFPTPGPADSLHSMVPEVLDTQYHDADLDPADGGHGRTPTPPPA